MSDSQERSHATIQVDRLLARCFPGQSILKLMSLRSCAIEKITQALRQQRAVEMDEEFFLELDRALQLLPDGDVRKRASMLFNRSLKAMPANYAAFHHAMHDPHAVQHKTRKKG